MAKDLPTLQSLRAVAALAVCGYHISQWTMTDFRIGQAGVDLFFVISGAVMWLSAAEADAAPVTFLVRRAVRLAPAYWAATFACVAIAVGLPGQMIHLHPTPAHVALSLAFIPHLDPEGQPFPLLSQGWSLTYEAFFYLVMAAALYAPKPARLGIIGGVLGAVVLYGVTSAPAYWLGANFWLLQFFAGAILGRLYARRTLPSAPTGAALLVLGFAIFAAMHLAGYHDDLWRPLLWGPPAILIVTGALSLEQADRPIRFKPLEALGDASYSLYLWHTLVIALLTLAIRQTTLLFAPLALAASLAAAFVSHRLIEAPFHALSRRLKGSKSQAPQLSTAP